jgi:hypothetical protein
MTVAISKSKYVSGLQCPKLLWTQYNDRDAIPPSDAAKQAIFDTGHAVGDLAMDLFPGGIEIAWSDDPNGRMERTAAETLELLKRRIPLYEASFLVDGCYCRADLLVPAEGDAWDLYEVKSTAGVKDVNLHDVAFQAWAIERCGVRLDRLYLVHLDNTYVRQGKIDVRDLFHAEDVTERARELMPEVPRNVESMLAVIAGDRPGTPIGEHCSDPYDCDLWPACSSFLPDDNVLDLYRMRKRNAFAMIGDGVMSVVDVPPADLNVKQRIQQEAIRTGEAHVQAAEINAWLTGLEYPLHCFDFETMMPAIPLFDGTRPYQQVPFQFSLHIVDGPDAEPRHVEFLAENAVDPRLDLIEALSGIGPEGTILAYNMGFEQARLREMARDFPTRAEFLLELVDRFQDLIVPFRNFWWHDARQRGSCSLKYVLPAVTGTTYEGLEIAEGGQAAREFMRVVFGNVDAAEKARVLAALQTYCAQDTLALVQVLRALRSAI